MSDDRGTPFFLSYARAGRSQPPLPPEHDPDRLVERFFRDLLMDVAELLGLGMGAEVGFMDRSMRPGTLWTDKLLDAVGTCQVLVALLSPRYLTRDWCGMEWDAFARRTVQRSGSGATTRQGCIIPVVWTPMQGDQLPEPVSAEMWFSPTTRPDPDTLTEYQDKGVYGLLRTKQEARYQIVAWEISREIGHVYRSHWLEHCVFTRQELSNIFQGDTP